MNVGDLVEVISKKNDYYGEIGIVTELRNDCLGFAIVHILSMSDGYWFSLESLEKIA